MQYLLPKWAQNLTSWKQSDGTFLLSIPAYGDSPVPMVEAPHDTGQSLHIHFQVPLADIALGNVVNALLQVEPGKISLAMPAC
jgi:hypothetical protein